MVGLRESATHLLPGHTLHVAGLDLSHAPADFFVPLGGDLRFVNRLAKASNSAISSSRSAAESC